MKTKNRFPKLLACHFFSIMERGKKGIAEVRRQISGLFPAGPARRFPPDAQTSGLIVQVAVSLFILVAAIRISDSGHAAWFFPAGESRLFAYASSAALPALQGPSVQDDRLLVGSWRHPDESRQEAVSTGEANLGGKDYKTVEINGLTWLAQNLDYEVPGSWCYEDKTYNCSKFGRLYTWKAAKAACTAVGWRLPTDEEWRELAKKFGGVNTFDSSDGSAAYHALTGKGESGFAALLGGSRYSSGGYVGLDDNGRYWSSGEYDFANVWIYYFNNNVDQLHRLRGDKSYAFSCRCVRK